VCDQKFLWKGFYHYLREFRFPFYAYQNSIQLLKGRCLQIISPSKLTTKSSSSLKFKLFMTALNREGHPLLQKAFVVSVGNTFMVSVRGTDTICTIQKINHLLYRLERTDMKNQFSKIKKTSFCRRPDPHRDPAEGGGGHAQIRRREEAALGLVVAEVGKKGVGGRRSASWLPRWGRRASVGVARGCGRQGGEGGC
jgi:hypothetical protein